MKKIIAAAAVLGAMAFAPANAATIVFEGNGPTAIPTNLANATDNCGTIGGDFCTITPGAGFDYSVAGIALNVLGLTNGVPTTLIQDVVPGESGLGVLSPGEVATDDQVQFDSNESLLFSFSNGPVTISNIEFNSGNDTDCSAPGSEGPCGTFNLLIDGVLSAGNTGLAAVDLLTTAFVGSTFEFVATELGAGFAIARFDVVSEVPVPGALPLLLSGIAGLSFASRKKKTA